MMKFKFCDDCAKKLASEPLCVECHYRYFGKEKLTKPPLGLRPKWLVDELRIEEVKNAMERYIEVNKPIPIEWINEYNDLAEGLAERRRK
jgi:hypothetical protein